MLVKKVSGTCVHVCVLCVCLVCVCIYAFFFAYVYVCFHLIMLVYDN